MYLLVTPVSVSYTHLEREEGREEGSKFKLLEQIIKKLRKDKTPETIADELEEDEDTIQHLCACLLYTSMHIFYTRGFQSISTYVTKLLGASEHFSPDYF